MKYSRQYKLRNKQTKLFKTRKKENSFLPLLQHDDSLSFLFHYIYAHQTTPIKPTPSQQGGSKES